MWVEPAISRSKGYSDMWNTPTVQSRSHFTNRLSESVGLVGPRWHGSSWQRGIADEWKLSAIDSHDRHIWRSGVRSAMRAARQLSGRGPTDVDVAPVLHVNQKSDYDMMIRYFFLFFFSLTKHTMCVHCFFKCQSTDIFLMSRKNLCCGYLLEKRRQGASNECPNISFCWEIRKLFIYSYMYVSVPLSLSQMRQCFWESITYYLVQEVS